MSEGGNESSVKKSGEIARLVFSRNADGSKEKPENGKLDFTVMINPESISRALSIETTIRQSQRTKGMHTAANRRPYHSPFTWIERM